MTRGKNPSKPDQSKKTIKTITYRKKNITTRPDYKNLPSQDQMKNIIITDLNGNIIKTKSKIKTFKTNSERKIPSKAVHEKNTIKPRFD